MTRRLRYLSADSHDDLPDPCRSCMFWEAPEAPRGGAGEEGRAAKEDWLRAVTADWGPPGRLITLDDEPVAFALLVPGPHAGRVQRLEHAPSRDALLLTTMWVDERVRGAGLGRTMLQALLRDTYERGGRAVEAYGARGVTGVGRCVLSESFLRATGFSVLREDARMPLLRLDLRKTVRWQESVAGALEQVVGALSRRRVSPAPVRPARGSTALV